MRPRTVIFAFFFALMSAYAAATAYHHFALGAARGTLGWSSREGGGRVFVDAVRRGGAAAALREGDEVLSVDGEAVGSSSRLRRYFGGLAPGSPYTLRVRRDGQTLELTLRPGRLPASRWANLILNFAVVPAFGLLTGLAVFLLKPEDKQARLLAVLLASVCGVVFPPLSLPWWLPGLTAAGYAAGIFAPAVLLHFFLIFPQPAPPLRRFPRLELWLYAPYLLTLFPLALVFGWLMTADEERGRAFFDAFNFLFLARLYGMAYGAAGLLALASNYRRAGQAARRKMRVVLAGAVGGVLPFCLWAAVINAGLAPDDPAAAEWINAAALSTLPLLPASFAYAIVRHQVIPVSLIIRRSVQYLLAKNALRALLLLPAAGLVLSVALAPHRSVADVLLRNSAYFYALAAAAAGLVFRRRLNDWIDRKFFREQFDREKLLRGLVEEIKGLDSIPEMSRRVSEQVERAVHPESLHLFYREAERATLSLTYASGAAPSAGRQLRIPEDSQLLRLMELQGGAQDFPFPPKTRLPQGEKDWLASLGTRLVVPMTGTDERLAGLFLLGGKKSEVPYTARDRELLESVAAQAAVVYENVRLKERAREDRRVRHEVLSRFGGRGVNLLKECGTCGRCFDSTAVRCDADGAELQLSLPVERTVEGRYRLERLIGRGGMGAVYEATHLRLNHRVAVKILSGRLFGDEGALKRFGREARALARLGQHPNVVAVHDYGELQTEGAFLVMDFIEGESLASLLKRERRLPPARAAELFGQLLEGVGAAHRAGVVHRDLKPDNILVSEGAPGAGLRVRLLDFGLAKQVGAEGPEAQTMTTPGVVLGTFGYMPPEQLAGGEVDFRADLFSVGVICAEALTGARPFRGRTVVELLRSMERGEFRLAGPAPEVKRLSEVLRRALAPDPARRHATASEMSDELIPALRACPPLALAGGPALDADTVLLQEGVVRGEDV